MSGNQNSGAVSFFSDTSKLAAVAAAFFVLVSILAYVMAKCANRRKTRKWALHKNYSNAITTTTMDMNGMTAMNATIPVHQTTMM